MPKNNLYRFINLLFYLGVIVVNVLAVTLPLGGNSTGEISDKYHTSITPAGYAFSIWGLIYLLLAGFILYQFRAQGDSAKLIRSISIPFIVSCAANMTWLLLWHYLQIELSVAAMVLLLVSLIAIYRKTAGLVSPTPGEGWLVKLPFSIYLGWISVATIVNVSIVLKKNGWDGFGLSETAWAVIMLCVGALLAVLVSFPYRNWAYPLVFVWAYVAIAVEQRDSSRVYMTALVLAGLILVYTVWIAYLKLSGRRSTGR
jgi:translocator protein